MGQSIVPMVAYADAAAAIDWLTEAFGFRERAEQRHTDEHGTVGHAEVEWAGEVVMLATPNEHYEGPRLHRATCESGAPLAGQPLGRRRALRHRGRRRRPLCPGGRRGREGHRPLKDSPDAGMRLYTAEDCEGHRWMFGQPFATVSDV